MKFYSNKGLEVSSQSKGKNNPVPQSSLPQYWWTATGSKHHGRVGISWESLLQESPRAAHTPTATGEVLMQMPAERREAGERNRPEVFSLMKDSISSLTHESNLLLEWEKASVRQFYGPIF